LEWRRYKDPNTVFGLLISVPYFCCVIFFATFSSVPWLHRRFSLRTLLIATTLVAIALGVIVYAMK
jgi:hypothetical protein